MEIDFQEFIERVKQANNIEDVIEASGEEYKLQRKRGNYLRGESHDSLVVRVDEQYYVWNDRNEKGDIFNWLEERNNWDFWTSLQWLAERAQIQMPQRFLPKNDQERRVSARIREDAFGLAQKAMARWLWEDPEALEYGKSRGWSDETIKAAGIGFSGRAATAQVSDLKGDFSMHGIDPESPNAVAILGFKGNVKAWGKKWGIEVQDNWIEWRLIPGLMGKTRLVYPHWFGGRVRYLSARNILGAEVNKEGRKIKGFNLPQILAGDRRPFFNHVYGRRAETCVVVEGQADAITLAQWDIPAMAIAGTSWQDHTPVLEDLQKRHQYLYLGLDKDDAGFQALIGKDKDWPLAQVMGPMTRILRWPVKEGKDANDWLKEMEEEGVQGEDQAHKAQEALAAAVTFAEETASWAGSQKGAERDQAINLVFRLIAKMPKVQRMQYRSKLCERMDLGISEFNAILKAAGEMDEDRPQEIVETLGGSIEGWLVEYIYDPEQDEARLAYRDPDKRIGVSEHLDISGVRYIPRAVTSFIRDGGVLFPSKLGQLKDTRELVAIVESFITRHYLLEDPYLARIIAYYVMLTWVYDSFNALPYLRAMGEPGAGKSELMRRVGFICYRMMTASGANTAASFFRATETYRGTVFIDEADLHDGGDMSNDLVKFLNLGAMKGNPIWRLEEVNTESGKSYEVATFSTFCPKLIAMRKEFRDDAVGTRSLTIKLMPREPMELKAAGVGLYIDDEFRQKAMAIRNLLLRWRLQVWEEEIEVTEEHMDLEISSRLNQVTMPLKALAKDDFDLKDEIVRFLRAYNREIVLTRSMTIDARIVEAMWKIYRYVDLRKLHLKATPEGREYIMIGDVCKIANEIMDEMNRGDDAPEDGEGKPIYRKKDKLSPRGTGHIIRNNLQMQVGERKEYGYPVFWDDIKMQALAKRYGVDFEAIPTNVKSNGEKELPKQEEIPF